MPEIDKIAQTKSQNREILSKRIRKITECRSVWDLLLLCLVSGENRINCRTPLIFPNLVVMIDSESFV